MGISIITDSACDMKRTEAEKLNVSILPLKTRFGDTEYLDGVTISTEEFFEKLIESDEIPTTSQITPAEYEAEFKKALDKGDDVICITLSEKLSGCHQSAVIAAKEIGDERIHIFDSDNVCVAQQMIVRYACRLRDEGLDIQTVLEKLEEKKNKVHLIALLDTLEYLKKGGRLSKTAAAVGTLLSIKPVVCVEYGEVKVIGKARGSKNGNNMLTEEIGKCGGIDFSMPYCVGYSGLSDILLKKYMEDNKRLFEDNVKMEDIPIATIGSTIGTHAGPGAIAVCFFSK